MKLHFISSSPILKKFLIFNFIVFVVLGLFTFLYLKAIEPNLVKNRSNHHLKVINNTSSHINRLNIDFTKTTMTKFLLDNRFLFQNLDRVQFYDLQSNLLADTNTLDLAQNIFVRKQNVQETAIDKTEEEIAEARAVALTDLPDPQKDEERVKDGKDEWLVMLGVCTHLGCVPLKDKGDYNGWFCPCHGSHYDVSGRIRKGPAPKNLEIPKYEFVDSNTIKIG